MVDVPIESKLLDVELLGPVHVRDRHHDQFELVVHLVSFQRDTARVISQLNVDRTCEFIAAYNRRDFDAAIRDFHPQVEWVLPALQRSDSCIGPEQVIQFWDEIDENMDELQLRPQEFRDGGDLVAVRLRHYGVGKGSAP